VEAVLLPGQPELLTRAIREREGVPVPEKTWDELQTLAREWGVPIAN
jgi:LDH2 family malate/lactate/ureidoglycolate dehydrogenase